MLCKPVSGLFQALAPPSAKMSGPFAWQASQIDDVVNLDMVESQVCPSFSLKWFQASRLTFSPKLKVVATIRLKGAQTATQVKVPDNRVSKDLLARHMKTRDFLEYLPDLTFPTFTNPVRRVANHRTGNLLVNCLADPSCVCLMSIIDLQ